MPGAKKRALSRPVSLLAVGPGHSGQGLRSCESHCKFSCHRHDSRSVAGRQRNIIGETAGAHMAIEDDDKPRKKVSHEIGQDLSLLSVEELAERIALMNSEIERLQAAMTRKRASRDAANSFFKS